MLPLRITQIGAYMMAFILCVVLVVGLTQGQPQNPYYSRYDSGGSLTPDSQERTPDDPTVSIQALIFMQSPIDHTKTESSNDKGITQQNTRISGDDKPGVLPPGISKLFPTFLVDSPQGSISNHSHVQSGAAKSNEDFGNSYLPGMSSARLPTVKGDDPVLSRGAQGLPGVFAGVGSTSSHRGDRKVRRNRDRNHHRKSRQRQSDHFRFNQLSATSGISSSSTGEERANKQTKIIAQQHLTFLSSPVQVADRNSEAASINRSIVDGQAYAAIANGQIANPGHGIRRVRRRQKRATTLPGRGEIPGEAFYYRRPDNHGGAVLRGSSSSSSSGSSSSNRPRHDPQVHIDREHQQEELEPSSRVVEPPPDGTPSTRKREPEEETDQQEDEEEDSELAENSDPQESVPESPGAASKPEESAETPDKDPQPNKKMPESLSLTSSQNENNTVNETLARQMFRSPMLVDYGSRVKPQDVLPTEPDPEEEDLLSEVEAEGEAEAETEPEWGAEGDQEPDELSLADADEEDPQLEDSPPEVPEVEPETEEEPQKEEIIESMIELPIIPLRENPPQEPETASVEEQEEETPAEPESEGEAEPESEPEPEMEPMPTGEPESEGETEPELEQDSVGVSVLAATYAEPEPEWDEAKKIWGPWWEVHIYGFGMAFAVLAIYSFVSIFRLWRKKNLLSQGYFIALNCIMFVMGFIRALYFLVDGYNSNKTFSIAGHYFLYSIGFPCLTSAFSILLLALLQTLKMQILSPKIQRTRVVVAIIAGHVLLSVTTDVIVGYLSTAKIMLFVCQVTTVLWGLFLFVGYIYVFRKLYKSAKWRQNEMMRLSLAKFKLDGISPITKGPRHTLNMAVKITLATSIFGLILAGLQTYGMVGAFSVFSTDDPHPWTWWGFKTGIRLTELAMCITMSYIATQPFRYNKGGKGGDHKSSPSSCFSSFIYMAPCRRIFECDSVSLHDDDLSWNDLPITRESAQMDDNGAHVISEEATPMTANGRAAHAAATAVVHQQNEREGSVSSKRSLSSKIAARPASLLVSDNGFIRFREDGELGGSPVLLSTDDELENIGGENIIQRNPFYRDLLRRQERERAVGRATFVNSDGITLQDEFGVVEDLPDQELVPPPRPQVYPVKGHYYRGCSYPNTGTNTPGTPRSFCSTDLEYAASEISLRPPSSIHLRDSIENALNIPGFTLRTPDILDSPLNVGYLRTRRGSLFGNRIGARPMGTGSMSDLESLRHYGPASMYEDSEENSMDQERAASPDSMYSYTLSNLTRAPLVRSYSDSIGKVSVPEVSVHNSPEHRRFYKDRLRASMLRNMPENSNQFQNLLKNINDMCNVYNKLSPDDREGDE